MFCPKCKTENSDNAKFCKSCGSVLSKKTINHQSVLDSVSPNTSNNDKKMIVTILAIVAIILVGTFVYSSGILSSNGDSNLSNDSVKLPLSNFNKSIDVPIRTEESNTQKTSKSNEIELETQNLANIIKISVPKGSNFVEYNSDSSVAFYSFVNNGKFSNDVYTIFFSLINGNLSDYFNFVEKEGNIKIYTSNDNNGFYVVEKSIGGSYFVLGGYNLDLLKKMINSIEVTNKDALSYSTSYESSSNLPLSILGGSISTGSGLSDKTKASIYVGSEHAGEKVIIQIYYSRDGDTLNNGNMVPKTVDSSGYINVNSANAFELYPDFAVISLYDANKNIQDSVSVTLNPDSGKQTF